MFFFAHISFSTFGQTVTLTSPRWALRSRSMSKPVRACGEESFDMVVPAMKVKVFNFTEVTKF